MLVSHKTKHPEQAELIPQVLPVAACRNYVGDYFEEATAVLTRGTRLRTDSTKDVCPDIRLSDGSFLEVKSIGCGNAAMAYHNRLEKDMEFIRQGNKLEYLLWKHNYRVNPKLTLPDLREGLANATEYAILVPFETFYRILTAGPKMILNAKNTARGYGSLGYREGYRTRMSHFLDLPRKNSQTTLVGVYHTSIVDLHLGTILG